MNLKTARDDGQALVLEQKSPQLAWTFVSLLVSVAILGCVLCIGDVCAEWITFYKVLCVAVILAGAMFACSVPPYYEGLTLDRGARNLLVVRKRALGTSRKEIRFEQVRSITAAFVPGSYYLLLVMDDRTLRFPWCAVTGRVEDPQLAPQAEGFASALRAALGLPQVAPAARERVTPRRLKKSGTTVLRDDEQILALEDRSVGVQVIVGSLLLALMLALVVCTQSGLVNWLKAGAAIAVCGAIGLAIMCYLPYQVQHAFDRAGRRILRVQKCCLRTACEEFDFDDVQAAGAYLRAGRPSSYRVTMKMNGKRVLDLTPTCCDTTSGVAYGNCKEIAELINDALDIAPADREEPAPSEPAAPAELASQHSADWTYSATG